MWREEADGGKVKGEIQHGAWRADLESFDLSSSYYRDQNVWKSKSSSYTLK